MKLKFEGNQYKMGEMSSTATVNWEFPYEGKSEDIEWTQTSCGGCTQVLSIKDGKVTGQFKAAFSGAPTFKDKPISVDKTITICETGEGSYFEGEGPVKNRKQNKKKVVHRLMIVGTITSKG